MRLLNDFGWDDVKSIVSVAAGGVNRDERGRLVRVPARRDSAFGLAPPARRGAIWSCRSRSTLGSGPALALGVRIHVRLTAWATGRMMRFLRARP